MSAQRADDHSARNFVDRLLHTLAQSANVAGSGTMMTDNDPGGAWQRNVKQRVLDLQANHPSMQVANARFALGADDGAYLRSNVMPLQTSDTECDANALSLRPPPAIEAASRQGVLKALLDDHRDRAADLKSDFGNVIDTLSWLLSIREVAEFACAYYTQNESTNTVVDTAAFTAAAEFASGPQNAQQGVALLKSDMTGGRKGEVICALLHVVLLLFGAPRRMMERQLAKTLGTAEANTEAAEASTLQNLNGALDRLAISARFVPKTLGADKVEVYTDPAAAREALTVFRSQRKTAAAAVAVNAAITGRIDFEAVTFPVGYDASVEFDHHSDAAVTVERQAMRLAQRLAWNVSTGTSAEVLSVEEGVILDSFIEKKEEQLRSAQGEVDKLETELKRLELTEGQSLVQQVLRDESKQGLESQLAWQQALYTAHDMHVALLKADRVLRQQMLFFVKTLVDEAAVKLANINDSASTAAAEKEKFGLVLNEFADDELTKNSIEQASEYDPLIGVSNVSLATYRWSINLARIFEYRDEFTETTPRSTFQDLKAVEKSVEELKPQAQQGWGGALIRTLAGYVVGNNVPLDRVTNENNPMMQRLAALRTRFVAEQFKDVWPEDQWVAMYDAVVARNNALVKAIKALDEAASRETEFNATKESIDAAKAQRAQKQSDDAKEDEKRQAEEVRFQQEARSYTFCSPSTYFEKNDGDVAQIQDALSAGITQMREDGGFVRAVGEPQTSAIVRRAGISPFFTEARSRPLVRAGPTPGSVVPDWWSLKLWPGAPEETLLEELPGKIDSTFRSYPARPSAPSLLMENGVFSVAYTLARGLCGKRAPHHAVPQATSDSSLRYNTAAVAYKLPQPLSGDAHRSSERHEQRYDQMDKQLKRQQSTLFGARNLELHDDFVAPAPDAGVQVEPVLPALWVPVEQVVQNKATQELALAPSDNPDARDVADAVVMEHLVDYFKRVAAELKAEGDAVMHLLAVGAAAYTKVHQLPSLCSVLRKDASQLCNPKPELSAKGEVYSFFTRPVLRCPGAASSVLYPCDAGLAAYAYLSKEADATKNLPEANLSGSMELPSADQAYGTVGEGGQRNPINRARATSFLRSLLSQSPAAPTPQSQVSEVGASKAAPVYVAAAPGSTADEIEMIVNRAGTKASNELRNDVNLKNVPDPNDPSHLKAIQPDAIESALREALGLCIDMERYNSEITAIEARLEEESAAAKAGGQPDSVDEVARARRQAVWNDAMREACVSGDRLYAFARQFAGTISEQVDSICLIDEGMLVRQQQEGNASRQRLADRAAQEHMGLVRSVFASVLKESGLTLGIETQGSIGELKVVSNSLRKQASELAAGGSSSEGYFANSVRLENLLASGTGEITLSDLFQRLGDAGKALQQAALSSQSADTVTGASLDFLSAPRNSLLLRWKAESLAAVRQAFDLFTREMLAQHGPSYRNISAYELIEGCDDALCSSFAQFCAHCLVHSRLYSSSTAMYVAAWPAAANATQLKISLRRLINLACQYLSATATPAFLSENGRANYFTCANSRQGGFGLPMITGRHIVPPGGLWKQNFYG